MIAVELVAVHCTSIAACIGSTVVASGGLASIPAVGTGIVYREFETVSTAGLTRSRSFPARVGSLHLQIKGLMWKAESSMVALA